MSASGPPGPQVKNSVCKCYLQETFNSRQRANILIMFVGFVLLTHLCIRHKCMVDNANYPIFLCVP